MAETNPFNWQGTPRPDCNHPEVKRRALRAILPQVMGWVRDQGDEPEEEGVLGDLIKHVDYCQDGYATAKDLEFSGWSPDAELVVLLDRICWSDALNACVREWMQQNGITPKLKVGDRVRLKLSRGLQDDGVHLGRREMELALRQPGPLTGEITQLYDDGRYCLLVEALGHAREGIGTHGIILPFDVVERMETAQVVPPA